MQTFKQYILEDKTRLIKRLRNLSRDEKNRLIRFFKDNPHLESEIDWNRKDLTFDDFQEVLNYRSKAKTKKLVKQQGIKGLREGIDYIDVSDWFPNYYAYIPLDWEASKHIASKYIGKCEGKWCTAYQKHSRHWDSLVINDEGMLIYLVSEDGYEKYAIFITKNINFYKMWDKNDNVVKKRKIFDIIEIIKNNKNELKRYYGMVDRTHWIERAIISNDAEYKLDGLLITWYNGTWYDGIWDGGKIIGGIFKPLIVESGVWKNGTWVSGVWKGGTWEYGTWLKGIWEDGTWLGGYDKDGNWHPEGDSPDKW